MINHTIYGQHNYPPWSFIVIHWKWQQARFVPESTENRRRYDAIKVFGKRLFFHWFFFIINIETDISQLLIMPTLKWSITFFYISMATGFKKYCMTPSVNFMTVVRPLCIFTFASAYVPGILVWHSLLEQVVILLDIETIWCIYHPSQWGAYIILVINNYDWNIKNYTHKTKQLMIRSHIRKPIDQAIFSQLNARRKISYYQNLPSTIDHNHVMMYTPETIWTRCNSEFVDFRKHGSHKTFLFIMGCIYFFVNGHL